MYPHHAQSIIRMTEYFRKDPQIQALFLIGSVATHTERPDSDLDGVAVIPSEYYAQKQAGAGTMEVVRGHCTYEGGYFDIHFLTKDILRELADHGSEPMRNMFSCAQPLFCDDPELLELASAIPVYPRAEKAEKLKQHYCTFKMFHRYFWKACKPEGYARIHVADGMIYSLYRLILLENELLFPGFRKLEARVIAAPDKPEAIVEKCRRLISTLSDDDAAALVEAYENWTSYDYPKDQDIVSNNFRDPYDW